MENKFNQKCPGVKRLMREAIELAEPTEEYYANPLEDNLFEWHFTVRGPPGTEFEGGYYHGRILLPTQYPMQPPNIILLTPNGRFEVNKKICLSISGHHPESWQPSWSIRTALLALIAFMPTPPAGTIGSLDYTPEERRQLAKKSQTWECSVCGNVARKLKEASGAAAEVSPEESDIIKQIALKAEEESKKDDVKVKSSSAEVAGSTELRQRSGVGVEVDGVNQVPNNTDSLLRASIDSVNRDMFWSVVIWVIVSMIVLLVIRRLFFV